MEFDRAQVYVVGGSLGIGLAVAERVAALGADVVVLARRREPLEQAAAAVRAACRRPNQSVFWRQLDVADHEQVAATMNALVAEHGAPDVLINCAGRAYPRRFEDVTYDQFAETMLVNLHGCWNTVQALLPHMKARKRGYIVNTSSLAGLIGVFGYTDYCASKFALVGFSEALRGELKPHGITVSVLCPPDTDTPGLASENLTKPEETRAIAASAKVLSATAVADALLRGMARRRFLIIPGFDSRLGVLAKRFVPGVVHWVMDRTVATVAHRHGARPGRRPDV
ncbi:MAG TPA: SDR family oxidoreductase [Candidatus Acidoferrales bacterium]|nr:SDR family oxidoreductase [Candidatus Acidoferrales bacterium]